ncbi:MAG: hypothetical protein Q9M92_10770 [Enterobacterales bacterium]|nr:hypothetical protein [Enterobacterales bacterium]
MKPKQPSNSNKVMISISNQQFQSLKTKGVQVVSKSEINLTVYTNPQVGGQYKNHLLNEANFKGNKIQPKINELASKSSQNLKTDIAACKPFEMKLPDNLVNTTNSLQTKNKAPQYQLLLEGKKPYLYNNQPGRWSQPLAQRVEHQLKSIKTHLKNATDLKQTKQQRATSWEGCKKQIDSLKSSLSANPKNRDPNKLSQQANVSIKVNAYLFKGENSVQNDLAKYWKKNGDKFESSDNKGMQGVALNIDKLKENMEILIKQIEKLIQTIQKLIAPKA